MSQRFAVVYEADADYEVVTELADRVLVESINDWLDADQLVYQRTWIGQTPAGQRLTWKAIPQLAREAGIRAHGHFGGEPGLPDAAAARRAILYLLETFADLNAILLVRDQDDQPERRGGLEQARMHDRSGLLIIVGVAVVEREAWVVCGFDPLDREENSRLQSERTGLGFDPREGSHELTACKDDTAKRSPKRVLRVLTGDDRGRELRCWRESSLDVLRRRGGGNGLAAYLREVRSRLAPLIGHVPGG
jgi:hypothetical protein